ncbi:MAG: UDP-N-acetylmuramoyl-tripeptide--D-alanyl-D-alanine ligase [Methylococcaceae bacterium]|nr:UDP-N-acetylmuramoyl-tripeptide--D-alanyl-D-alanine ligase [Methylococcaceae bacterium]
MKLSLSETAQIVKGRMAGADVDFSSVSIDTRSIGQGDLFVAIEGKNFDAHEFLEAAADRGAVALMVARETQIELPTIRVGDTRIALGELARGWRIRCTIPVVGVTGSNGKTSVKEMIAAILAVDGDVLYTRGNLNNEFGVPLTLLGINDQHRFAVIEMGANHRGEIAYTAGLALPDVGVITNAGAAHLEGFGDLEGVARAKGELVEGLADSGTAVLNADDRFFGFWQKLAGNKRVISFGLGMEAEVRARDIAMTRTLDGFANRFTLVYRDSEAPITLRLAGRHNVCNALAAAGAALALGIGLEQIKKGLEGVVPVPGRMQPVSGLHGSVLFDDTYNANPSSFAAAVDVVSQLPGELWVILGAFAELGGLSAALHEEVGRYAKKNGIRRLLATGADAAGAVESFGEGGIFFEKQEALIEASKTMLNGNVIALVKGSRSQKMERVIRELRIEKQD